MNNMCPICGNNSITAVSVVEGNILYSCFTEGCINYAELLVQLGPNEYVNHFEVIDTLTKIVENEKTDIQESES